MQRCKPLVGDNRLKLLAAVCSFGHSQGLFLLQTFPIPDTVNLTGKET
jgi:hypothetical protein